MVGAVLRSKDCTDYQYAPPARRAKLDDTYCLPAGIRIQFRGTAVIIFVSYVLELVFQLKTNPSLFQERSPAGSLRDSMRHAKEHGEANKTLAFIDQGVSAASADARVDQETLFYKEEDEEETPVLGPITAFSGLILFTTLPAFNMQIATDSVQGIMAEHNVSITFMGIMVSPILSNDPMTIDSKVKDKMVRSIVLTLERCMQSALMIVSLTAWNKFIVRSIHLCNY